ncbi:hypothetical protein PV326_001457 [Microctonus aethiopoides]|nr:hypothetical protein PV326_001457 [Microctonus aethiopoides]
MALKNILALSVLLCFSTYYIVEGEVIHGVEIPKLNITGILGKWYLVGSTKPDDEFICTTTIIEQQSENNFTIEAKISPMPFLRPKYPSTFSKSGLHFKVNATKRNDSSIINLKEHPHDKSALVIFDVNYDSYMVFYTSETTTRLMNGNYGLIFIFSREKALSEDIFNKVESSNFYTQGVNSKLKLLRVDASVC